MLNVENPLLKLLASRFKRAVRESTLGNFACTGAGSGYFGSSLELRGWRRCSLSSLQSGSATTAHEAAPTYYQHHGMVQTETEI